MRLRAERAEDAAAIRALTTRAFAGQRHSGGSEADIIERLRAATPCFCLSSPNWTRS